MPHVHYHDYDQESSEGDRVPGSQFNFWSASSAGGQHQVYVAIRPTSAPGPVTSSLLDLYRGAGDVSDLMQEVVCATVAAGMRSQGAVRAYCLYDGGDDEGFARFDHCVFKDGSTRKISRVAADLAAADPVLFANAPALLEEVASTWAVQLLGRGYGTGAYTMYGGFWVDLDTGLVTDDPDAQPRGGFSSGD